MSTSPYFGFSIDSITLENYRCFDSLHLRLHPHITALTAPNGGGKSAVLQALAVACAHFAWSLHVNPGITGFPEDAHRLVPQKGGGMVPALGEMSLECSGHVGYQPAQWRRARHAGPNSRTRIAEAAVLAQRAQELQQLSAAADVGAAGDVYTPLIAFYDTRRLAREKRLTENKKADLANRFDGYQDCLTIGSSIRVFRDWFRRTSEQRLQETINAQDGIPPSLSGCFAEQRLKIVRAAIDRALAHVHWGNTRWNFTRRCIELTNKDNVTLSLEQLSDGIQNVFCLVADMVHRAVRLNPCCGEDLLPSIGGLVLIDEVDLYLHPSWQQQIVSILRDIFPRVQFVISTHSPQVLSTLKREHIRILRKEAAQWSAEQPDFNPYALSAEESLSGVLGTNPMPRTKEFDDMQEVEKLYRAGRNEEADALREELARQGVTIEESDVTFWKRLAAIRASRHA